MAASEFEVCFGPFCSEGRSHEIFASNGVDKFNLRFVCSIIRVFDGSLERYLNADIQQSKNFMS